MFEIANQPTSVDCERFGHEWEQGSCIDCGAQTHFRVLAREMLFENALPCPQYGALTFDGLAITATDDVHLILRTAAARAYFGPDAATVTRHGLILLAALDHSDLPPNPQARPHIMMWLSTCWTIAIGQIQDAATERDLAAAHAALDNGWQARWQEPFAAALPQPATRRQR